VPIALFYEQPVGPLKGLNKASPVQRNLNLGFSSFGSNKSRLLRQSIDSVISLSNSPVTLTIDEQFVSPPLRHDLIQLPFEMVVLQVLS
jgi:hypothetical protein